MPLNLQNKWKMRHLVVQWGEKFSGQIIVGKNLLRSENLNSRIFFFNIINQIGSGFTAFIRLNRESEAGCLIVASLF